MVSVSLKALSLVPNGPRSPSLRVQFGAHLVFEVDDILREVFLLLLHLLQGVGHILHPGVVVLQGLLDVADIKPSDMSDQIKCLHANPLVF